MKVAVYRSGKELISLTFKESAMDKLNFWNRGNLQDFTVPSQWTDIPVHLDLNATAGYCCQIHNFVDTWRIAFFQKNDDQKNLQGFASSGRSQLKKFTNKYIMT